jgi:RNA polymerase sigma-70 factor (ECF subfamily)
MHQVHEQHAASLFAYLYRLTLGDRGLAEDLLQETMLRAWRHIRQVPPDYESQRRWLFTVARHAAIDAARNRGRRPSEVDVGDALTRIEAEGDEMESALAAHVVARALPALSELHRSVVVGLYLGGLSTAEMADQLGVPEGTVKSRAHYAIRALRAVIGRMDDR